MQVAIPEPPAVSVGAGVRGVDDLAPREGGTRGRRADGEARRGGLADHERGGARDVEVGVVSEGGRSARERDGAEELSGHRPGAPGQRHRAELGPTEEVGRGGDDLGGARAGEDEEHAALDERGAPSRTSR